MSNQRNVINIGKEMKAFEKSLASIPRDFKKRRKAYQSVMRQPANRIMYKMQSITPDKTGRLEQSIKVRPMSKSTGLFIGPQIKGRGNKAPHWHLVAYGTKERKLNLSTMKSQTLAKVVATDNGPALPVNINGRMVMVTSFGKMPANNYAAKTASHIKGDVIMARDVVQKDMSRQLKTVLRRNKLGK